MIVEQYGDVVALCETWDINADLEKQQEYWQNCLTLIEETNLGICWDFLHSWFVSTRIGQQRFQERIFWPGLIMYMLVMPMLMVLVKSIIFR